MHKNDLEFGIEVLHARVDVFTDRLMGLVAANSDKAIHETRVESRRMRAALEAFREMFPPHPFNSANRAVRQITKLLGGPRETAVTLKLAQDLAKLDSTGTPFCDRLNSDLRKQKNRLREKLRRLDPARIRSKLEFLLSVMDAGEINVTHETPDMRFYRILKDLARHIAEYRSIRSFDTASDEELHSLRIAVKNGRYAMEIFSPIWPGGLVGSIEKARSLQDCGGAYHDWNMLRSYLDAQSMRLHQTTYFPHEISGLIKEIEHRKSYLKTQMRAAFIDFHRNLHDLQQIGSVLAARPNRSPNDLIIPGGRVKARSKLKSGMSRASAGSAA